MTQVRDATCGLFIEGVLAMSVSGRINSPELNSDHIEELSSIRFLFEPELAFRAALRVPKALIERLMVINSLADEIITKENSAEYIKSDIEFHKTRFLRA